MTINVEGLQPTKENVTYVRDCVVAYHELSKDLNRHLLKYAVDWLNLILIRNHWPPYGNDIDWWEKVLELEKDSIPAGELLLNADK